MNTNETNSKTTVPYDWVKDISPALVELDQIPLLGNAPPFPWEGFNLLFKRIFDIEGLHIQHSPPQWKSKETILTQFDENPVSLNFTVFPLEKNVTWLMSDKDIIVLMSWLLTKQTESLPIASDKDFKESFYHFIALEAANIFSQLDFDKSLSLRIAKMEPFQPCDALTIDISLQFQQNVIWGRLILTDDFLAAWRAHYSLKMTTVSLTSKVAKKVNLTLHLELGNTVLKYDEWNKIRLGDFIVLDSCSFNPDDNKGRIAMTLNGHILYYAMLKSEGLKILEIPLYQEATRPMTSIPGQPNAPKPNEGDKGDSFSPDEDFENETEESSFDHEFEGEDLSEFDDDFDDTEFEDESHEHNEENEEGEADEEGDENEEGEEIGKFEVEEEDQNEKLLNTDEEFETEIESDTSFEEGNQISSPSSKPAEKVNKLTGKTPSEEERTKDVFTLEDFPLTLTIEAGRLEISIQKLMELQPGNLLELNVKPENGVDLVVNGKCIGKGELFRIGETLGVRVLDII